eukprot:Skav230038  [mRNA]  locus=scaffold465:50634:50864:- [translate_table: standard]
MRAGSLWVGQTAGHGSWAPPVEPFQVLDGDQVAAHRVQGAENEGSVLATATVMAWHGHGGKCGAFEWLRMVQSAGS